MISQRIHVVTGTDTGVGKTVLTSLLVRRWRERGIAVAALKPLCSGSRDDAACLHRALEGALPLDVINPWHFRAPLTPLVAARLEGRRVRRAEVLRHIRRIARQYSVTLVEGAGGLLSPLGSDFDSRDLVKTLRATPILVGQNRLGVINQVLLAWSALPPIYAKRLKVVLVTPELPDASNRSNLEYLRRRIGPSHVHPFPWVNQSVLDGNPPLPRKIAQLLDDISA